MAINFLHTLTNALKDIGFYGSFQEFTIHEDSLERCEHTSKEIIKKYGKAKWEVVDILNSQFSHLLETKFDLYNWLNHNTGDEVAYFLNEAGSNTLNYSEFKAPHSFKLWLGKQGFIIGIHQHGAGFDALKVFEENIKENQGAAFDFFRSCSSTIFFDDPKHARTVFMEVSLA